MKVVMAEKPSVAREIAAFLGATTRQDGYLEGNGYLVTWAVGHLVTLADLEAYPGFESKKWHETLHKLPYIPTHWKLRIGSDDLKKQYFIVKSCFDKADEIIVATDAGREGELIFRHIYTLTGCKKPFSRLWISSLTQEALSKGFAALRPGSDYDNLFYAAQARSRADWLVGINLTRLFSCELGNKDLSLLSIGRVQTPTLNLICQRYLAHTRFVKTALFTPHLLLSFEGIDFKAISEAAFIEKPLAEAAIATIGNTIACTKVERKDTKENAPVLFNLNLIQQHGNQQFKLSAQKTLDILQALYEKKFLTYPRTDSSFLSEDMKEDVSKTLWKLVDLEVTKAFAVNILNEPLSQIPFDNNKVTDHHAIIPTAILPVLANLSDDEKSVYLSVVERFFQAFSKPCLGKSTTYFFDVETAKFKALGKVITFEGWKVVSFFKDKPASTDHEEEHLNQQLPMLEVGNICKVMEKKVVQSFTKPPALFTEALLLKAVERADRFTEGSEISFGIGTPATRANIIETLLRRLYLHREGTKLIPTQAGLSMYEFTKNKPFGKVELTADFEKQIEAIANGTGSTQTFMSEISSLVAGAFIDFQCNPPQVLNLSTQTEKDAIICPQCSKGQIIERDKFFGCTAYQEGCDFKIWKELSGRKLTFANIKTLIQKGKTASLSFVSPKNGKSFDALVVLKEGKLSFEFLGK
jgi:DNA topoisomerase III